MSNKEKLPKLVDVYRPSNPLEKRQLPLVVDENLTVRERVFLKAFIIKNPCFVHSFLYCSTYNIVSNLT